MIKNSFKSLLLIFTLLFTLGCSDANAPKEGKHYALLPNDLSELNLAPVTEVFALTCGHCRNMEHMLPKIEELIHQDIGKVHVTYNKSAQVSSMFYYAAVMQLNKAPDSTFLEELFAAIQMRDATMTKQKEAINKAFNSRGLKSPYDMSADELKKMDQYLAVADQVTQKGQINAVPTFIVAGKYQVLTEGHESLEEIADTMKYLMSK